MKDTMYVKNTEFQLCSVPDSEGLVLEISEKNEPAFMEIRVDSSDVQWVRFFSNEKHFAFQLKDLERAVEIAKKEVVNVSMDWNDQEPDKR